MRMTMKVEAPGGKMTKEKFAHLLFVAFLTCLVLSKVGTAEPATRPVISVRDYVSQNALELERFQNTALESEVSTGQRLRMENELKSARADLNELTQSNLDGKLSIAEVLNACRDRRVRFFLSIKDILGPERYQEVLRRHSEKMMLRQGPQTEIDALAEEMSSAIFALKLVPDVQEKCFATLLQFQRDYVQNVENRTMGAISFDESRKRQSALLQKLEEGMKQILPAEKYDQLWKLAEAERDRKKKTN